MILDLYLSTITDLINLYKLRYGGYLDEDDLRRLVSECVKRVYRDELEKEKE